LNFVPTFTSLVFVSPFLSVLLEAVEQFVPDERERVYDPAAGAHLLGFVQHRRGVSTGSISDRSIANILRALERARKLIGNVS
jgi:hypothetical protein